MGNLREMSLFEGTSVVEIRKHSGMVQMSNITTLQQRKAVNAMMRVVKNILDKNPNAYSFRIEIGTLKRLAGIKDHNNENIKKALKELTTTQIEYNLLGKDKEEIWGIFNILAQVEIKDVQRGEDCFVEFAFPPKILEAIKNPRIYAKLDLYVLRNLNSKYSIALYEILKDYQNLWHIRISVEQFRDLMGVEEGKYKKFTFLKNSVIETATKEINKKTDIIVSYDLEKLWRKITAINFQISPREKEPKQIFGNTDIQLQQFWFSQKEVEEIKKKHTNDYIIENIKIVEKDQEQGKVKNLKAYLKSAFDKDFRPQETEYEKNKKKAKEELAKKEEEEKKAEEEAKKQKALFEKYKKDKVSLRLEEQGKEKEEELKKEFEEEIKTKQVQKNIYEKYGFDSPFIQPQRINFIVNKAFPSIEEDFDLYLEKR